RQQLEDLPFVRAIWVMDADGLAKYGSDIGSNGIDFSDRDCFRIYRTQPQTKFYIGLPERSRTNGKWLICAALPRYSADGKFAGVIVAALETTYFDIVWRMADLGAGSLIALWQRNGTLMMRSPISEENIGKSFKELPLFREILPGNPTGTGNYRANDAIDGEFRSFSYRTLSTEPDLVVVVGRSFDLMLKPWRDLALLVLILWAAASTMLLTFCIWLSRTWRQRLLDEASSDEMAQRLALATDVASMGIWDWNVNSGAFFATPSCFTMLGDDPGDGPRRREQWLDRVHPEDRHTVDETIRAVLAGAYSDYKYEVRMQHADGSYRWVGMAGRVLAHNADGKASRILGVRMDFTDRKHAEVALQQSEERYRGLVEWSPEPACVHRDGIIIYVNPATVKMVAAKSAQELVGRRILDLVHPDSQKIVLLMLNDLTSGTTQNTLYELKLVKFDETVIDLEIRGTRILYAGAPAVHASMRDVTAAKEAEDALRKSEVALAEAQRVAQIGSWTWLAATDTFEWSDQLFKILALDLSSSVPNFENQLKLFTVESAALLCAAVQRAIQTGDGYTLELERRCDDGERRWVGIRGEVRRSTTGRIFGLRGTLQNITERKRAEATRASLEAQLRESQKMEAIGTLAGGIAHDFNNILATILGNATLVRQDLADNPQALQGLDEITKAGSRARDLVRQILSFSRRDVTQRIPIALAPVVDEAANLLRASLPPHITFDVHCDTNLPTVLADANQIRQVIINLVTNAMQAMREQPGEITIRLGAVTVDAALIEAHPALRVIGAKYAGRALRLVVSDDGPGMDAATVARIFEPFFTTKAVDEGTGLGLSVVHGIVKVHEGEIVIESQIGSGTSFAIYLPIFEQPASASEPEPGHVAPLTATTADAASVGGRHILYIDDDEALVFLVQRTLEGRGYRISGHTDQHEALAALRADPASFDLVVTDYNMPGMSGLDVAREMRAIRPDLPLAIASGFIDETLRAQADGAGVRELIFKANAVEDLCGAFARLADATSGGK
ncbi:MAG: PAS domain S-box protein, partial [Burkholderiales bacterium]|nr:PAS domain S-box protein [Burkholderiales bacterium]